MKSIAIGLLLTMYSMVSAQQIEPKEGSTDANAYLNTLNQSIEYYLAFPKLDSAGLYLDQLKAWSDSTQEKDLKQKISLSISQHLGPYLTLKGKYPQALQESKKALNLIAKDQNRDELEYAEQLESVGIIYELLSDLDSAMLINQKSRIIKEIRLGSDHIQLASAYRNIGSNLSDLDLNDSALYYFHSAKKIHETQSSPDQSELASLMNDIGLAFLRLGEYDSAEYYYGKGVKKISSENLTLASLYSNLGHLYYKQGSSSNSYEYFKKCLRIRKKLLPEIHPLIALSYGDIGLFYAESGIYDSAEYFHKKAFKIIGTTLPDDHLILAQSYTYLAEVSWVKGYLDSAIYYLESGLEIEQNIYGKNSQTLSRYFNNLGIMYSEKGEYKKSRDYYFKDLELLKNDQNEDMWPLAETYENIALNYADVDELPPAIEFQTKAIEIYESLFGDSHPRTYTAYANMANMARQDQQLDVSLFYIKKAQKAMSLDEVSELQKLLVYRSMSLYYLETEQPSQALSYLDSIVISNEYESDLVQSYNLIIQSWLQLGNLDEAHSAAQKALEYNQMEKESGKLSSVDLLHYPKEYFITLGLINEINLRNYQVNRTKEASEKILHHLEQTDKFLSEIQRTYLRIEDKVYLRKEASKFYDRAVKTLVMLYEDINEIRFLEEAFSFTEKSKSATLREILSDQRILKDNLIPKHVLNLEEALSKGITFYQSELNYLDPEHISQANAIKRYENELFQLRKTLDSLKASYRNQYPEYFKIKFGSSSTTVTHVKQDLGNHEAVLQFFNSDTTFYVFLIDQKQFKFFKSTIEPTTINKAKVVLSDSLRHFTSSEYVKNIYPLYNQLLLQPLEHLNESTTDLTFIPTPELSVIPFELLVTSDSLKGFKDLSYLFLNYTISTAYSTDLSVNIQSRKILELEPILAFAPSYEGIQANSTIRSMITPLQWNETEASIITDLMEGTAYLGGAGTENNFKKEASKYQVLHLAMHALVDYEESMNSKLVFTQNNDSIEDGMLHTFEIFNMRLNAELAVLSACNTGVGKVQAGEGVMSLARAFAYAGVPSLIMSHWNVNDESTAKLMTSFYQYLAEGDRKDEALRKAKLDFLDEANEIQSNPFFWGGFVLVGDTRPINENENYLWWLLLLIPAFGVIGRVRKK